MQPISSWADMISYIEKDSIDGLILDLRLYEQPVNGAYVSYRGTSIAQELRTRQKEGNKSFPIFLYSAKMTDSLEQSAEKLFDICIDKTTIDEKKFPTLRSQFIAITNAYKLLSSKGDSTFNVFDYDVKDNNFISEFNRLAKSPDFIKIRFLLDEFIKKPGLLIDESLLAARLGVNKESEGWQNLLKFFDFAKYNGILCTGWERWWMPELTQWFKDNELFGIQFLKAEERVELIKKITEIKNLTPAKSFDKSNSTKFWTICKGTKLPLDPNNGMIIQGQDNIFPWQDIEYVSIDAALKKTNQKDWGNVASYEISNLEHFKKLYSVRRTDE